MRARARVEAETAIARRLLLDTRACACVHQILFGFFFPSEKMTKLSKKLFVFSVRKKSEYFCLPIIYRPYISLALYPLAPSTCCPVYSSICFAALFPPLPTPFPPIPRPISIWRDINRGRLSSPSQCRAGGGERGKSRLMSPSRFLLLSFISRTTTPFYFRIMSSRLDLQLKCAKSVFFFLSTKKKDI